MANTPTLILRVEAIDAWLAGLPPETTFYDAQNPACTCVVAKFVRQLAPTAYVVNDDHNELVVRAAGRDDAIIARVPANIAERVKRLDAVSRYHLEGNPYEQWRILSLEEAARIWHEEA